MKFSLYWSNRERGVVMLAVHLLFACTNIFLEYNWPHIRLMEFYSLIKLTIDSSC